MLQLLADEHFSHRILRGIKLRSKNLEVLTAQAVGLGGASDPALLAWAAERQRILLTHDRQTTPKHAHDRMRARLPMPGVVVVSDIAPVGEVIELVTLYLESGSEEEFDSHVIYLP